MQVIDWTSYGLAVMLARRQRDLKQRNAAHQLGISRQTLSYIERGTAHPRWHTLQSIETMFDVSVGDHLKEGTP